MILRRLASRAQGLFYSPHSVPLLRYLATKGSQSSSGSSTSTTTNSSSTTSGSSSINSTPAGSAPKQKARDWFIVGASGSIAVGGAYWYLKEYSTKFPPSTSAQQQQQSSFSLDSVRTAFAIPVRSSSDRSQTSNKIVSSLLPQEVNARLRKDEKSIKVERPPGSCIVERYETNTLASNDPIEDRKAEVIVERDRAVEGVTNSQKGDLGFFAVMDGHAGWDTSTLLSNKVNLA